MSAANRWLSAVRPFCDYADAVGEMSERIDALEASIQGAQRMCETHTELVHGAEERMPLS